MTTHTMDDVIDPKAKPLWFGLLKLARIKQWSKGSFVMLGPLYGLQELIGEEHSAWDILMPALLAALAFCLASSACYVINDLVDREADRLHPRKRRRPIASGRVSPRLAVVYSIALFAAAVVAVLLVPGPGMPWVALVVGLHVANVLAYSALVKQIVILDVMSLAMGFVFRMVGGCAAVGIEPTVWLLNVTFFLSMFLAFGKRLGERRTLAAQGSDVAGRHRKVQESYTDATLQMAVVVTAVTTLMTYALYLQTRTDAVLFGFNALWLTMLPATYGLLRAIILLEHGRYDDPTELAVKDRPFQLAGLLFAGLTIAVLKMASGAAGQ